MVVNSHLSAASLLWSTIDAHQISKKELADRLGISITYLKNILARKSFMRLDIAVKIEQVLGLSAQELLLLDLNYRLPDLKREIESTPIGTPHQYLVPYYWVDLESK